MDPTSVVDAAMIKRLRRRARGFRAQAWMSITLVVVSLCSGIYLFLIAGNLTKSEDSEVIAQRLSLIGNYSLVAGQTQAQLNRIWLEGVREIPPDKRPPLPPVPNITDRILPEPNAYSTMA